MKNPDADVRGGGWFWKFGHTRTRGGGVVWKSEILADVLCRRPLISSRGIGLPEIINTSRLGTEPTPVFVKDINIIILSYPDSLSNQSLLITKTTKIYCLLHSAVGREGGQDTLGMLGTLDLVTGLFGLKIRLNHFPRH